MHIHKGWLTTIAVQTLIEISDIYPVDPLMAFSNVPAYNLRICKTLFTNLVATIDLVTLSLVSLLIFPEVALCCCLKAFTIASKL